MEKYVKYKSVKDHDDHRSSVDTIRDKSPLLVPFTIDEGRPKPKSTLKTCLWTTIAALAMAGYTVLVAAVTWKATAHIHRQSRHFGNRFLSSPANEFIEYETRTMDQWEDENAPKYFGTPSLELDQAWHKLFEHQNIGLQPEIIKAMGRQEESILLKDGTYFGTIMVFHNLHCLKNLQHALHPEYYGLADLQGSELAMHWEHTNHCLHMLMDAIMCQGDTSLITMLWEPNQSRPIGNLSSPHECVNWDRLMDWVVPNSRDLFHDGDLVHPKFGPLMVDGRPTGAFFESLKSQGFGNWNTSD